jgi:hypothetical protein
MRPVLWLALFGVLAAASAAPAADGRQAPGPSITVAEPRHSFGAVVEGSEVLHDFVIRNRGAAPLNLLEVKTG